MYHTYPGMITQSTDTEVRVVADLTVVFALLVPLLLLPWLPTAISQLLYAVRCIQSIHTITDQSYEAYRSAKEKEKQQKII